MATILENISRRTIIEVIIIIISTITIAIILSVFVQVYLATDLPQVVVTTSSMSPTYLGYQDQTDSEHVFRGDLLIVKGVPPENIQVGDTIIFDNPIPGKIPIVHRVVKINESDGVYYFWTKGDNPDSNQDLDYWSGEITGDEVHGVVILRIPHIGWIIMKFQDVWLKTLLVLAAIGLLILGLFESEDEEEEEKPARLPELVLWIQQKLERLDKGSLFKFLPKSKNRYFFLFTASLVIIFILTNLVMAFGACNTTILDFQENYSLTHSTQTVDDEIFIPLRIGISSHGIFNTVQKVEIRVNNTLVYRWTVTYAYHGYKIIGAGILVLWESGQNSTSVVIDINTYAVGLLPTIHTNNYLMHIST